jgi:hypothetical protein
MNDKGGDLSIRLMIHGRNLTKLFVGFGSHWMFHMIIIEAVKFRMCNKDELWFLVLVAILEYR